MNWLDVELPEAPTADPPPTQPGFPREGAADRRRAAQSALEVMKEERASGTPGSDHPSLDREMARTQSIIDKTDRVQSSISEQRPTSWADIDVSAAPEESMPPAQPPVRDIITGEMMWGEPGPKGSWLETLQSTAPQLASGLNQFVENIRKWHADAAIERSYEAVEKLKNPHLSEGARRTAQYDVDRLKARIEKSARADKGIAQNAIDAGLVTPQDLDTAQQAYISLVQSSPPMLLGTAAAIVTKNPAVAWMLMGGGGAGMQGASTYVEAKQKTGSFHAANVSGLIDAGLEIFGESLPVYAAFQKGVPGLHKFFKVMAAEGGEEVATQFMQDIHKWALYDRSITWPEMVKNMEIAGLAGAGGGAFFGGAVALTERGQAPGAGAAQPPEQPGAPAGPAPVQGGAPEAAAPPTPATDMTHQLADGTPVKAHVEDGKPVPGLWETATGDLVEAGRAEPNTIEPNAVWKTGGTEYEVEVTGKGQADGTARLADGQEIPINALQLDEDAKVRLGLVEPKEPAAPAGGQTESPPPRGPTVPPEAAGPQQTDWASAPRGIEPTPLEKQPSEKLDQYRARMKAKAEQKKKINTNVDSLTDAIIKLGGINMDQRLDILGDDKEQKHIPFVGYLFSKGGTGLDDLATRLQERGYLTQAEIDDPNDNGGIRLLAERIKEEMAGRDKFYSGFRTVAASEEDLRAEAQLQADMDADRQLYDKAAALEGDLNREPGLNISPEEIAADGLDPTPERLAIIDLMRELPENIQERVAIANAESSEAELLDAIKAALKEVQRGTERVSSGAEAARPSAAPAAVVEPKGKPAAEQPASRPAGETKGPEGGAVGQEAGPEVRDKRIPFSLGPKDVHWEEYLDFWAADILGRRAMVWKPSTEARSTRKHWAVTVAGSGGQLQNKGIAQTLEEAKKIAEEGAALRPIVAPNQKMGRRPGPGKFALSRYHITAKQEAQEWLDRLMERHGDKWLPRAEKAVTELEETLAERPKPNEQATEYTPAVWEMRRSQELATQMRYAIGQQRRKEGIAKLPTKPQIKYKPSEVRTPLTAAQLPPGVGPEEKAAALRDRDVAVLTPPEGTAPPKEAVPQPTQQAGLFTPTEAPVAEKKPQLKAKGAPGQGDLFDNVDDAAAQTAKKPTEAQQEAENYRVGKFQYEGITTSIETAAGQKRRPEWPALKDNYGRILGTVGFDKDHVDIFWKPGTTAAWRGQLYVVNQQLGGKFDEHKVMGGYGSLDEARTAYLRNYEPGWNGLDSIIPISVDAFKSWAYDAGQNGPKAGKLRLAEAKRREISVAGGAASLQAGAPSARDVLGIATLPRRQARNTVDEVKAQFSAHPIARALGDKVSVIQSPLDLPPHVLREAISNDLRLSQIRGYWDPVQGGQIYVVAGTIPKGEAGTILLHEAVGHYGVAQVLGEEGGRAYNAALQEIYDARRPEIAREVRSGFLNAYNLDLRNAEHQRTAASEYIAHMAETGAEPTLWQKFVATVKRILRKFGLTREWSDGDILHLLQLSRSSLINGGGATYNGMAAYDQFGSSLSLGLTQRQQLERAGPRYNKLARQVAALELKVDRAYGRGQKNAEDLDAQLAELREQLTSLASDVAEGEGQDFDYSTFPEHAANLYHSYLAGQITREQLNDGLGEAQKQFTGGIANYTPATDEQLFAAAKDAYQAYMDRVQARRGKFSVGPRGLNEIYGIRDGRLLGIARRSYTGQGVWQVYLTNGTNENLFARGAFRKLQAGSIGEVRRIFNREGLEFRAMKPRNVPVPDSSIFDQNWVAPKLNAELRQPSTWLRYTIRYLQNRLLLPELYERTIAREVGPIPEVAKAHREARLAHQRAAGLIADFDHAHTEPILEIMKRQRLSLKDVGLYLYAKVAPEVNAYVRTINPENISGSGMTDERAAQVMEAMSAFDKAGPLEQIATMVRRIVYEREQVMIDKGLLPAETVLGLRARYPNYVPLKDMLEDEYIQAEIGAGYRVGRQVSPRFGRFTEAQAEFILPAVIAQAKGTISAGENAEVLRAFLRLVEFAPNPTAFEIERGVFKQAIDKDTGLVTWTPRPSQMVDRTHLIPVPVNGEIVLIRVADEDLAKAFNTSGIPVPESLQMLGTMTRFYAVMATGANPEFPGVNFLRDIQQAGIRLSGEQSVELAARMGRDAPAAFWGAFSGLRAKGQYVPGKGGSAKALAENWHAWYRRYIEAGGHIAYRGLQDVETQHKNFLVKLAEAGIFPQSISAFQNVRLRAHRLGRKIGVKQLSQLVLDVNGAIENSVRLATFKNAIELGFNDKDAAFMARNVSVDFNLKGEAGALIGSLYMFFNANIQDVALLFRSVINHPKIKIAATALFFLGMLLSWWNRQWAEKTKDGRNYYDNISRSIKQRNWVIMGPDRQNAIIFPIPFGFGIFPVAGANLMDALPKEVGGAGKPALEAAGDTFVATINALSPFGNVPESWLGAMQVISPTPTDPAAQAMTNRDFSDKSIVPERPKQAPPQAKASTYFSGTPEAYIDIAQWLNSVSGGNEIRSGWADVSPNMIQHWVRSIFGSTGAFWARVGEGVGQKLSGKEIEARNMPFVRRFYYEPKDYELSRRFYDNVNQSEVAQVEVQHRVQAGDPAGAAALRQEFQGERKLFGEAMDAERQVAQHRQNIAKIKRNPRMADEQKKLLIDKEESQSREVMQRFNLHFEQAVR